MLSLLHNQDHLVALAAAVGKSVYLLVHKTCRALPRINSHGSSAMSFACLQLMMCQNTTNHAAAAAMI